MNEISCDKYELFQFKVIGRASRQFNMSYRDFIFNSAIYGIGELESLAGWNLQLNCTNLPVSLTEPLWKVSLN